MSVPLSADRWKTLEPLIDAAVELAPDARQAFVREACRGDAALEAELMLLLAEYDRVDAQFDRPAAERFPSLMDDGALLPKVFDGRYRIERELGRGGMATVYVARDLRHERDVAVKVLHPDLAAALGADRFLSEIKTTARLQHPHILALHDSGEADGFLFYVMPLVDGMSLRRRLEHEAQLPIDETVRIASEVASALDAAHKQGVIHRDIKPENILLHNGAALVADFGIALALAEGAPRKTHSGLALGTPQYMSPEQAMGGGAIDARADVYALGTVVFEMLAGEPPFTGATSSAILAKRAAVPAPPVRVLRPAVTPAMDAAVAKALAREPVDRWRTAGEFVEALQASLASVGAAADDPLIAEHDGWRKRLTPRRAMIAASVIGAVAAIAVVSFAVDRDAESLHPSRFTAMLQSAGMVSRAFDTSAYVVVADTTLDMTTQSVRFADALRNDLRRWKELTLADIPVVSSHARDDASPQERARAMAVSASAGRYVRTQVVPVTDSDSLDLTAALFDTRSNARISDARVRVAAAQAEIGGVVETVANRLLFDADLPTVERPEGRSRTTSMIARRAFLRGQVALEGGEFATADSEFANAVRRDPQYAQALVWLAQVRSWRNSADRPWGQLTQQAAQALSQPGVLAPADSMILSGLSSLAAGHAEQACPTFAQLTRVNGHDFAAWFALGNCLRHDSVVVRDAGSPWQWRFRSSYEDGLRAFEKAVRSRPSLLNEYRGQSLNDLQLLLYTGSRVTRPGHTTGAQQSRFFGIPVWLNDSLSFMPVPSDEPNRPLPPGFIDAIQRERERFRAIAAIWRTQFPQSADAAEMTGVALEMLGNDAGLDTLRLARTLAIDARDRLRMAAREVFLRAKFSAPANLAGLEQARALADSLLRSHAAANSQDASLLEGLAELTGKADLAASFAAASPANNAPNPISRSGPSLVAFAALGGPRDSLVAIEPIVRNAIATLPEGERDVQRDRWLFRSASLAFPEYRSPMLDSAVRARSPHARLTSAAAHGDSTTTRALLAQFAAGRRSSRPIDVSMDGIFLEAEALRAIGDIHPAIAWLDPPLQNVRLSTTQDLASPYHAGPFVRAMALRAELALQVGDTATARRWARAVVALWSAADPFLAPTLQRMKRISR